MAENQWEVDFCFTTRSYRTCLPGPAGSAEYPSRSSWVPSKPGTDARCVCFLAGCFSKTLIDFFFPFWWPHIGGCNSLDTESNTRWTQALQRNPYPILIKQPWDSQAVAQPRLETKEEKLHRGSKLKISVLPYLQPGLFYSV